MNKVILLGRLVSDIELRFLQSGMANASVIIAVDKGLNKEKKAEMQAKGHATSDFPRLTIWGKTAENMAKYFNKGDLVLVEGSLQTGSYEKNGVKHYTTDVNVQKFDFVGNNKSTGNQGMTGGGSEEGHNYAEDDFASMDDDESSIPF